MTKVYNGSETTGYLGVREIGGTVHISTNHGTAGDVLYETSETLTSPVSGTVTDSSGNPIDNATVEIWGVNYDHPDVSTAEDARDEIHSVADRIPSDWNDGISLTGPSGKFEAADTNYAAVTTTTVEGDPWLDSADLGSPQLRLPAGEPLVLTEWTPDTSLTTALDEYDRHLPGKTVDDGTIVIEELDAKDDLINRETYDLDEQAGGGFLDPSSLNYAEVQLQPGYYRVYPEGSPETSYVVQVGSTQDIIDTIDANLTTPDGLPSEAAKQAQSKLDDNLFERTTVTTNETGQFDASVPQNVETVGIQVYKAGGNLNTTDPSLADVREIAQSDYNGSIVITEKPTIVDTPATDVTIEAYEFSTPPFYNLSAFDNRTEWLRNLLDDVDYSDLPTAFQQRLENSSDEDLDELHSELEKLREQNDRLDQRYQELLDDDDSREEQIRKLQQALSELRETIEAGDPTRDIGSDTVSLTFPFSTNLNADQVTVLAHYSNGTTEPLSPENSSYVSIDNRVGGDAVEINDFPLGEGDAAVADFEVQVATADGIGSSRERVKNPTYTGDLPSLDAISLSTLRPGPEETVSVNLRPAADTNFREVTGLTVYGPTGSEVPSTVVGAQRAEFETAGEGVYHVKASFEDVDGNSFTETFRVEAGETDLDMPAGVRVKESPLGTYALTGDGIESGMVSVEQGGSQTTITAQIAEDADVPRELHIYTTGVSLPPDNTLQVNVVRGSQKKQVSQHVRVNVHMQSVPDGSILYREGDQPLPRDGETEYGAVNTSSSGTVIKTYTDADGRVSLTTNADPSIVERAIYAWRTTVPSFSLPVSIGSVAPGLPAVGGAAAILVLRRRRHA